mgnify:CR=1 FL=1
MFTIDKSHKLDDVCYDIRGPVHKEARRLEDEGHRIIKLNIGNPAPFGFEAPEEIIKDVILNMPQSQGYCDSKGLFSARKAVMQYYQQKGMRKVDIDDIYIGNGASELIVMAMQALLNNGDEMLVPSPDYPLWTACVRERARRGEERSGEVGRQRGRRAGNDRDGVRIAVREDLAHLDLVGERFVHEADRRDVDHPQRRVDAVAEQALAHRGGRHDHPVQRDTFARLDNKALLTAVPDGHHQLPLVIGVDKAHQVAQDYAMLMTQAGARQDHGRQAGIGQVDSHAGRYQRRLPGFDMQRACDTGPQVEAGSAGGSVMRRGFAQAAIENLEVDLVH